jgi:hypothetical protein
VSLAHPTKSIDELLDGYLKQSLTATVGLLRPHAKFL